MRLPSPAPPVNGSLEAAIARRRTVREFAERAVSLEDVGRLLWAAQGVTGGAGERAAPSAGARHPLSLTLLAGTVTGLAPGAYGYRPEDHRLEPRAAGDLREALAEAAIGPQPWLAQAALTILIAGDETGMRHHFADQPPPGLRGARYLHMEAGHATQNIYLQATALGLGAVLVGGFDDDAVIAVSATPSGHAPLGLLAVGHPADPR
ncbi:MAG: SagB/ThcOx family dehydrogenase [Micromonosporaceae bacterium]